VIGCATATSFTDTAVTTGITYYYTVSATYNGGPDAGGESADSVEANASPQPDTQSPTQPGNLTATAVSGSRINLSWTASMDNVGVTGYLVERCQGMGCSSFAQVGTTATTTFGDTGLTATTTYSYRVRATDGSSNLSSYSGVATTTTQSADVQPPTAPTDLTVLATTQSEVNLSWTASTDNVGVTGYLVQNCQGSGCSNFAQISSTPLTTYDSSGLVAGVSYSYRVQATDGDSNLSGFSNVVTFPGTTPPVTDNFNTSALNGTLWRFVNPVGDGSFSMSGTNLRLTAPAGSNHDPSFNGANNSVRVAQNISSADFTVTAKFDSIPTAAYQFEGILVEQDSANYLRFQFGSTGASLVANASKILSHTETGLVSSTISGGTTSLWLRVQKAGTTWTMFWSSNGSAFNTVGSFTQALTPADIGPFVGNYNAGSAPAFTASIDSFINGSAPDLTITKTHTGNFTQGQSAATYTLTANNIGTGPTSGTVTVTDTLPTGLSATGITGSGWNCTLATLTCTRSDALAAGASYPNITLTVNVASTAASSVTNTAAVSGGGETNTSNDSVSDVTTISPPSTPDLTITKTHTGNFTLGQTGATYTLKTNNIGTGSTSGTVTVTDTLPTGLSATAITGSGWTCTLATLTCTRSDALAAGANYPDITLTVNVAGNAPSSVTNSATVSGGGETNTSNDSASDVTGIVSAAGPPVSDDFNNTTLNTALWTFVNPVGNGSFSMSGTNLRLTAPAGSNHDPSFNGANNSVRVIQNISSADFTVTVKFDSIPTAAYQFEGILVEQDPANYLRFQFGSTGASLVANASKILSHTETGLVSSTISGGATSLWLRVQKAGTTWTMFWSANGSAFNTVGSFTQTLTPADIGLFVGNYNAASAPAFTASIDSFINGSAPDLTITKTHTGNFTQGQTAATYTLTANNIGTVPTSGTVTVTDTLPTGLTASAIAGSGWTCTVATLSCTRSDALAAGASYPAITLTVNVASNAVSSVTNTATVSGGGETNTSNDSVSDPTTINPPSTPDLTITKTHTGNFTLGQTGATYTLTAKNSGTAPTSGTVTVTDTLPTGLTATAIAGTGWNCTVATLSCTRSDALATGASYPAITLTVNVASNAASSVTNTTTVSGGGETNTSNDSASDLTGIVSAAGPPVSDDFNNTTLNTNLWTFVNPVGNGSFSMTGTNLRLTAPAGSNHDPSFGGANNSVRVTQNISSADFTVTVKFDSIPTAAYQFQGILVEQDSANYLRFQFGSTGAILVANASQIVSHTETGLVSSTLSLPGGTTSLWLRVQKASTTWTLSWSANGSAFNTVGSFTQTLSPIDIGPFVGNYNAASAPAFTASIDSFVSN
jgi:uncharacterized repeat protein (TIGR01451 family)